MNTNFNSHPYLKDKTYVNLIIFVGILIGGIGLIVAIGMPNFFGIILSLLILAVGVLPIKIRKDRKKKAVETIVQKTNEEPTFITEAFLVGQHKGFLGILSDKIVFVMNNTVLGFNYNDMIELGMITENTNNTFTTVEDRGNHVNFKTEVLQLTTFCIQGQKDGSIYLEQWVIDPNSQNKFTSQVKRLRSSLGFKTAESKLKQHSL